MTNWNSVTNMIWSCRLSDAWLPTTSGERLLPLHQVHGQVPVLHQPAGDHRALPPAPRGVRGHPHHLQTPHGGRVHPQSVLWEEEHLWVRKTWQNVKALLLFQRVVDSEVDRKALNNHCAELWYWSGFLLLGKLTRRLDLMKYRYVNLMFLVLAHNTDWFFLLCILGR